MKILHVIDVLTLGGAQALAFRTLEGLQGQGAECELCVLLTEKRTHPIWRLPIRPFYLEFHGDYRRPIAWSRCTRALEKRIREFKPDIVQSWNWLADVTAARVCRRAGVPHVAYLVDRRNWMTSGALKHQVRRWLTRSAFKAANTRFMAVSAAVAEFTARHLPLPPGRIDVVQNSIEVAPFAEVAAERVARPRSGPVTIGMLSQLKEEKGHRPFLDAVAELVGRNVPLRVVIAGEGPLREEIERRAAQPELAGCVSVVGLVDDSRDFYRACDVFVVPSIHSEGLPTTILEAMASGCAVVATDVGGAGEVIQPNVDGLLTPPNDPLTFADALHQVIGDQRQRRQLQSRAAERAVREFDLEQTIDRMCGIYHCALAGAQQPLNQLVETT